MGLFKFKINCFKEKKLLGHFKATIFTLYLNNEFDATWKLCKFNKHVIFYYFSQNRGTYIALLTFIATF